MAALAFDHTGLESSFHADNRFGSVKGRWNVPPKPENCQYFSGFLKVFKKVVDKIFF